MVYFRERIMRFAANVNEGSITYTGWSNIVPFKRLLSLIVTSPYKLFQRKRSVKLTAPMLISINNSLMESHSYSRRQVLDTLLDILQHGVVVVTLENSLVASTDKSTSTKRRSYAHVGVTYSPWGKGHSYSHFKYYLPPQGSHNNLNSHSYSLERVYAKK